MVHLRILVVDASLAQLAAIRRALFSDGHILETTTRKEEARGALAMRPYDLVIVDYHMPGQVGSDVLEFLKSGTRVGAPRFYMYTRDATNGVLAQELGFDGAFLAKGKHDLLRSQLLSIVDDFARRLVGAK
jgi:CheY-like chemotaxis protein